MAQRATVLAEKSAASPQSKRSSRTRDSSEMLDEPRPIPVDFRKIAAAHKRRGRLTLRVERVPHKSRFSAGRNNGDGSWSLALDELEDLEFLPSEVLTAPVKLAIRVVSVESSSAATIAVVDYEITPDGARPVSDASENSNVAEIKKLRRLRDELAQMAENLADTEAELEEVKAEAKEAQAELARARAAWDEETDKKIAGTQKDLDARIAEQTAETEDARAKAAALEGELKSLRKSLAERETELKQARSNVAAASSQSDRSVREAITTAEKLWKAGEEQRLAAAEAKWREQSDRALAQARTASATSAKEDRDALARQRDELAGLRKTLMEREADIARLRAATTDSSSKAESAIRDAVAKAEEIWKTGEALRLSTAEERWREQTEKALADARAAAMKSVREETQNERERQRDELAQLRAIAAGADGKTEAAIREAVSKAEESWKAGEAQRLAEAQAKWREETDRAVAEAREAATSNAAEAGQGETAGLKDELAKLKARLTERDDEFAQLQSAMTQAAIRHQRDLSEAATAAEEKWKAGEAGRLAAAETKWREQSAGMQADLHAQRAQVEAAAQASAATASEQHASELRIMREQLNGLQQTLAMRDVELEQSRTAIADTQARAQQDINAVRASAEQETLARFNARLAEATARYEAAESALVDMRMRGGGGGGDLDSLRDEINTLRKVLSNRESELAQYRSQPTAPAPEEPTEFKPLQNNQGLILGGLAAACVVMAGILFFPQIVSILPYSWQVQIYEMQTGKQIGMDDTAPAPSTPAKAAPAPAVETKDIVVRSVNMRASDSTDSDVLMKLESGMEVSELGTKGDWTHVRAQSGDGKPVDGWVFSTYLKTKPDGGN